MEFEYRYQGSSSVASGASDTTMSFAPDTLREPTYFSAKLNKHLPFREAISALNAVVVSDLRFQPKDREEYMRWLEQNEASLLAEFMADRGRVEAELEEVRAELSELWKRRNEYRAPFPKAQDKYFKYLYRTDYDAWFVLDPVITVHPDKLFFECFSQDESTYGSLSCSYDVFQNIGDFACGTTNIDYSAALYDEFQKIRDYRDTELRVEAGGFEVKTGEDDSYQELKIDLPDSWVRGFLQVSSAMTLSAAELVLHPMDVHNICFHLRRKKEKHGPRSLRWILEPGQPIKMVFEPWNIELKCPRSIYEGSESREIRLWGRRRLLILERLIPIAKSFHFQLLGTGLPAFVRADLGDMQFTLGLSGWTANDWSQQSAFDLLMPRDEVDADTAQRVFDALAVSWSASADALAARLSLAPSIVIAALTRYVQAGRVIYDLEQQVYRRRELSRVPLPMDELRYASPREESAARFVQHHLVKVGTVRQEQSRRRIQGTVLDNATEMAVEIVIDADERMVDGRCECHYYVQNKLHKGPCEHLLALRQQEAKK